MKIKRAIKKILSLTPKCVFNFFVALGKKRSVDIIDSEDILNKFYKDAKNSCVRTKKATIKQKYDLHIIVPCYNIKNYGKKCIDSILAQKTSYSFFVSLVNDGSSDNTKNILKEYCKENVQVINKNNGGPSSARNAGLDNIMARYIMFVDADDFLIDENVVDHMIREAEKKYGCEKKIVIEFSYRNVLSSSFKQIKKIKTKLSTPVALNGFAWGKIYSSLLFEEIEFPLSYWFEDTLLHTIVYSMADECYKCNYISYYYRPNELGITYSSKNSPKTLDTFYVTRSLLKDRKNMKLKNDKYFYYRFYIQTICNAVRLINFPENIRISVFIETIKLFKENNVYKIRQFKNLYNSFMSKDFNLYERFCKYYSLIYMNLD